MVGGSGGGVAEMRKRKSGGKTGRLIGRGEGEKNENWELAMR